MNAPFSQRQLPSRTAGLRPGRYKLTISDYLLLDERGAFAEIETELVDGYVLVMSPEWRPHLKVKSDLFFLLRHAVQEAGLKLFVGTEGSVALSETDMPRPDILLTSAIAGDGPVPGSSVPLLVEISATTLADDLGIKAGRYATAGIAEYWVADVDGRVIHRMWSPDGERYTERDEIAFGQELVAATMPELRIETDNL